MEFLTPSEAAKLAENKLTDQYKEHLILLSFNTKGRVLGADTISIGTLDSNLAHPREVFLSAIRRHAASVIIVHNHPSGDLEPSDNDEEVTKRIVNAGKILGIEVMDHLIIGGGGFLSFQEQGLLHES
jgi:DNA repair protein RadC